MNEEGWVNNPEQYARMSEPFANKKEALNVLECFLAEVKRLRQEMRIGEVICIAGTYSPSASESDNATLHATQYTAGNPIKQFGLVDAARNVIAITAAKVASAEAMVPITPSPADKE